MNNSPWLSQLRDRPVKKIATDTVSDVAIVGAGIAGVATSFFLLTKTDKNIILIDASRVAHGATGHNAGQITSYFERGFKSMADEFGLSRAAAGQRAIEEAWTLLDEMYTKSGSTIPFSRFLGSAGLSTQAQVLLHLENNLARKKGGLVPERFLIADHVPFLSTIPPVFRELYDIVPHAQILSALETKDPEFIALISFQKGCINSALLCEEVVEWLSYTYPDRFIVTEASPVHKIALHEESALLDLGTYTVTSERVVLCTNGFDTVHVLDKSGIAIDMSLHESVAGVVGYMSAYLSPEEKNPLAVSYLLTPNPEDPYYSADEETGDPYFLITRRAFESTDTTSAKTLISVAGPEIRLENRRKYSREIEYPDAAQQSIDRFVKKSYEENGEKDITYSFTWHGLMGYTPNGIRRIGVEPRNPVLLYNLGCNGVGILPSIYGGDRIARILNGESLEKSIFDPQR